jgi:hypothetical protein
VQNRGDPIASAAYMAAGAQWLRGQHAALNRAAFVQFLLSRFFE